MHRWYDPNSGRWTSEDPIGFAAGDANLYRYVGNRVTGATDPTGLEVMLHRATVDEAVSILTEGFKPGGGNLTWFASKPGPLNAPSLAHKCIELSLDIPAVKPDVTITHSQLSAFYKQAQAAFEGSALSGKDLEAALESKRWSLVSEFLQKSEGKYFRVTLGHGNGYFTVIRSETAMFSSKVMGIRGVGKDGARAVEEVIERLTKSAGGAVAKASSTSAARAISKGVAKGIGKVMVFVGAAQSAYQIYTAEDRVKETTVVAGGWAGAVAGAKVGGMVGGGVMGVVGQAGPQVAAPEEVVTMPLGALVGGLIGAVGGAVGGSYVTELAYEFAFEHGWAIGN